MTTEWSIARTEHQHDGPLFPAVGVIALVPDRQVLRWQPRHHVLTRLARYFHVVWVIPALGWREASRQLLTRERLRMAAPPGFTLFTPPPWLPLVYRPAWFARSLRRARLGEARLLLERKGCEQIVLYLWRPEFAEALGDMSYDLSCYHIDDEYSFSSVDRPLDTVEAQLIASVDQAFIHSKALFDKKGAVNPRSMLVPNGVDYAAYADPVPEPGDLAAIPRPRIGYTGHLKRQLDWALLADLAERHQGWSFVMVGAANPHPEVTAWMERLSARPNIHFLGAKSTEELAAYPQHFDVCVMPYQLDGYTKYIYPMKLHEYLASGRPVVGARVPAIEEFHDVVALASSLDDWSRALTSALEADACSDVRRSARQAVARQYEWNGVVARIAHAIAERIGLDLRDPNGKQVPAHGLLGVHQS
jgi:glycosyltransferase involved in cell wall biosynthesis